MEPEIEKFWNDGLKAALELLGHNNNFRITFTNIYQVKELIDISKYDFILGWGGFNSPVDLFLNSQAIRSDIKCPPMGLCIGGNAFPVRHDETYSVLFYETNWFKPQVSWHKNARRAFGINSEVFYQEYSELYQDEAIRDTMCIYDYVSIGSFSNWKRHEKMINRSGTRLCIGQIQQNNLSESMEIAYSLIKNGVAVSDMIEPYKLALILNMTENVYIPADILGGGERSVWEARACGAKVSVEDDNPKLQSLLIEPVLDEYRYYKDLMAGIKSCLK